MTFFLHPTGIFSSNCFKDNHRELYGKKLSTIFAKFPEYNERNTLIIDDDSEKILDYYDNAIIFRSIVGGQEDTTICEEQMKFLHGLHDNFEDGKEGIDIRNVVTNVFNSEKFTTVGRHKLLTAIGLPLRFGSNRDSTWQ